MLVKSTELLKPAKTAVCNQKIGLIPHAYGESTRVISAVMRETKGLAQGLTLFFRVATAWLFLGLSESSSVLLERISIVLWNFCLIFWVLARQLI